MAYATLADLEVELERTLPEAKAARAEVLLARAALLIDRVPGVADRVTAGTLSAEILRMVSVEAVARVLRTPAGVKSETIGPKSVTYHDPGEPGLYLTERELALLEPAVSTTAPAGARSVQMARPVWWR